jgi:hypothetical protein
MRYLSRYLHVFVTVVWVLLMTVPCWADGYYAGRTFCNLTTNSVTTGVSTFSRPVRASAVYIYWAGTPQTNTVTTTVKVSALPYLRTSNTVVGIKHLVLLPTSLWLNPVSSDTLTFNQTTNVPAQITIDWEY